MVAALSVSRLRQYAFLMRLHKPIGILLLLWPTWWALWLAAKGFPPQTIFLVFTIGVVLMRSAGCVVNDIFDRHVDVHVTRTKSRPLAAGAVTVKEAIVLAGLLGTLAFVAVLFCNTLTIQLSFLGALFAGTYPLLKRITHLPQCGLGIAFSWGIPMAFAAINNEISVGAWLLFAAGCVWPVIYDTMYAMTDRADDIKIGVKSTAILFGHHDLFMLTILIVVFLLLLYQVGAVFHLSSYYYMAIVLVAIMFGKQLYQIRQRDPEKCFQAFLNNNWIGMLIFAGIVAGLM